MVYTCFSIDPQNMLRDQRFVDNNISIIDNSDNNNNTATDNDTTTYNLHNTGIVSSVMSYNGNIDTRTITNTTTTIDNDNTYLHSTFIHV